MLTRLPNGCLVAIAGTIVVVAILIGIALGPLNSRTTRYVESPGFRTALEEATAKGLHFPESKFASIHRAGVLTARSEEFEAHNGWKAMTTLEAHDITGTFNPLGVLLRRWQIDDLHIDRARIGVHVYEPKPEPSPVKPWYHIFLPQRVYLKRVWSDNVDITWPMRNETGGIFKTRLVVTPHGRDFNYRASTGKLRNPLMPELDVREIYLLITKKSFTLYHLDLNSGGGTIHGEGKAGISGKKQADFKFKWNDVPVRDWLPKTWNDTVTGTASGDLHWTGNDYKLAAATMTGEVSVKKARVSGLQLLEAIAAVTAHKDLATLELDDCRADIRWREGDCELKEIAIEQAGKFRIEGNVSLNKRALGGTLRIGVSSEYLDWLPNPEEVFSERKGRYLWTTMHLSGTMDAPQQDLSPRLLSALKESPGALLGAAFRALGAWLSDR